MEKIKICVITREFVDEEFHSGIAEAVKRFLDVQVGSESVVGIESEKIELYYDVPHLGVDDLIDKLNALDDVSLAHYRFNCRFYPNI